MRMDFDIERRLIPLFLLYRATRMYEPHEARNDTVLFPAFRKIVSNHEYDALGEEFEKKENQIFHGGGFEQNVDAVAKIEKEFGNLRPCSVHP
jgi:hypothetical protein